jgi:hypothetical protein
VLPSATDPRRLSTPDSNNMFSENVVLPEPACPSSTTLRKNLVDTLIFTTFESEKLSRVMFSVGEYVGFDGKYSAFSQTRWYVVHVF